MDDLNTLKNELAAGEAHLETLGAGTPEAIETQRELDHIAGDIAAIERG